MSRILVSIALLFSFAGTDQSRGDGTDDIPTVPGFELSNPKTYRFRVEIRVQAAGSPIRGVMVTGPAPSDWREQKVKLISEQKPRGSKTRDRKLDGRGVMMEFTVPTISAGGTAIVERIYEITRYHVRLTIPHDELRIPQKPSRKLRSYLTGAPGVEVRNGRLKALVKTLVKPDDDAWTTVRGFYDWVRLNVKFQEGNYRGAAETLERKVGDCEDLSALFISLCRIAKIPARTVWIGKHAYSEFYLEDEDRKGYWIPAELTGPEWFGESRDYRTILQKGDKIRDPIRRRFSHYIPQSARAVGGSARLNFVREALDDKPATSP